MAGTVARKTLVFPLAAWPQASLIDLHSQNGPPESRVRMQCVSYWAPGSGQLLSWDIE